MSTTREQRIFNWVTKPGVHDRYTHKGEVFWGVFIVDSSSTAPIAMFNTEDAADMWAADLAADPDSNTEYDVSPCVVDISHRDNFQVPK